MKRSYIYLIYLLEIPKLDILMIYIETCIEVLYLIISKIITNRISNHWIYLLSDHIIGQLISLWADGGFVCKLCAESFSAALGSRGSIFQENWGWTCCNCPAKLSEEGFWAVLTQFLGVIFWGRGNEYDSISCKL